MTNEPEWMKRFNKKIKENYFVTPSSHLNVYGLKAFIKEEKEKTKAELLSKIEEEVGATFCKSPLMKRKDKDGDAFYLDVINILSKYKTL